MYLDVYIGDLDDPDFHRDGGDWSGNIPKRKSPFSPPTEPFWTLIEKIRTGELEGKQTDWGGWVARVTKQEIQRFMADVFGGDPCSRGVYTELCDFVASLDDNKQYALVASEL
jgi:hypothetical protein